MLNQVANLVSNGSDKVVVNGYLVRRPHHNTWSVVDASLKSYEVEDMVLAGNSPVKFFYKAEDVVTFLTTGKVVNTSKKFAKKYYSQTQLAYFDSINPERESGLSW